MFEKRWLQLLVVTLAVISENAQADLTGVWRLQNDEQIQVEYRDNDNIRMSVGEDTYQLLSNGRLYALTRDKGRWQVVDVDALSQQMQGLGLGKVFNRQHSATGESDERVTFRATGRKETVAGITGDVYEIKARDQSGRAQTAEAVLADNEQIVTLQRAMALLAARHVQAWAGKQATHAFDDISQVAEQHNTGALLRYEQDIQLLSLSDESLPDSRFQLPSNVTFVQASDAEGGDENRGVSEAIGEGLEKLKGLFGR